MTTQDWTVLLEQLESELAAFSLLVSDPGGVSTSSTGGSWTAPVIDSPLPDELIERAKAVLRRQEELAERLQSELADLARQRAQVRTLARGPERDADVAPVSFDAAL